MPVDSKSVTFNTDAPDRNRVEDRNVTPGSSRWWDKPLPKKPKHDDDTIQIHAELVPYVQHLETVWAKHDWFDRCHDRIYENRVLLTYRKGVQALASVGFPLSRLMVTTSIVDTFHSRFERRRPMPTPVVDDADYDLKMQAQEFKELLHGKMREKDVDHVSSVCIKDSDIRGTGVAYVDEDENDIIVERVHRWELFVDPHEAAASAGGTNDTVRQMHRIKRVAREVLAAMFPDYREQIYAAPASRARQYEGGADEWSAPITGRVSPDMVDVFLSWHLPSVTWSAEDDDCCDDGRKAICIEGATLYFGRWRRPRFPFALLRRYQRQDGFWGQGTVERLAEDQHDVNRVARDIQRNVEMDGHIKVFTPASMADVPTSKLTGRQMFRIEVPMGSSAPTYVPPNPVSPAHLAYLEKRIAWMHDFSGVSQWSAQGRSPLGAGASGVAIDTMEDLQSDRHASFEMAYSRWRCEVAQLVIDACNDVATRLREEAEAEGKKSEWGAVWQEHGTLRRMVWDPEQMKEGSYRIDIEPVSWLPTSIPGKIARIKELSQLGLWSPEEMLELYDLPDLAGATNDALARRKNCQRVMKLLSDPKQNAPAPEPEWGYELHLETALRRYNRALVEGAPEEVCARFRDYATLCQDAIDKAKPAAPVVDPTVAAAAQGGMPTMPPPPMDPMGAPPMPPVPPPLPMAA